MRSTTTSASPARSAGFTLMELLVVIAIIGVLAALIFPVMGKMQDRAKLSREVNAARQTMVAFAGYVAANDGQYPKGYEVNATGVTLRNGRTVDGPVCARYPWRLAPYIDGQVEGIFLINDGRSDTKNLSEDSSEYQYLASLHPALGMNGYCIGGYADGSQNFQTDVVRNMGGAAHASKLIAFASARFTQGTAGSLTSVPGFHTVQPPRFGGTNWQAKWDRSKSAASFGYVDMRWDGKATCAFLDGHVEMLGDPQIRDMRRWSNGAAEENSQYYTIPRR